MIVITNKMNKLTQKKNSITTIIQNTNNIIKDINKNRKQIEEEKITEKEVPSIITPETPKMKTKIFLILPLQNLLYSQIRKNKYKKKQIKILHL